MESNIIAVYGTLRKGQGNHKHFIKPWLKNRSVTYMGSYLEKGFTMSSNGGFPYVWESSNNLSVAFELYRVENPEVQKELMLSLDYLEGYPDHYDRKIVTIGGWNAWTYLRKEATLPIILSGNWTSYQRSLV